MRDTKYKAWYGDVMFQSVIDDEDGFIFVVEDEMNLPKKEQIWYSSVTIFAEKTAIKRQFIGINDKYKKDIEVIGNIYENKKD